MLSTHCPICNKLLKYINYQHVTLHTNCKNHYSIALYESGSIFEKITMSLPNFDFPIEIFSSNCLTSISTITLLNRLSETILISQNYIHHSQVNRFLNLKAFL